MADSLLLGAGPAGMLTAVACVVAGGPWFADGLRAVRQRRVFAALRRRGAGALRSGLVLVRGRVALESPLFAPLSQRPCAGFVLDVRAADGSLAGSVRETRSFRLETEQGDARVDGHDAHLVLSISQERRVESAAELSANVAALLDRTAELRWLKSRGGALLLVERVLLADAEGFAVGVAQRTSAVAEAAESVTLARTGTDDVAVSEPVATASSWRLVAPQPLDHCVVSDREPEPMRLAPPRWRTLGALLGPALALAGLLELAQAAGHALGGGA